MDLKVLLILPRVLVFVKNHQVISVPMINEDKNFLLVHFLNLNTRVIWLHLFLNFILFKKPTKMFSHINATSIFFSFISPFIFLGCYHMLEMVHSCD